MHDTKWVAKAWCSEALGVSNCQDERQGIATSTSLVQPVWDVRLSVVANAALAIYLARSLNPCDEAEYVLDVSGITGTALQ
jgi:hypothetical protein